MVPVSILFGSLLTVITALALGRVLLRLIPLDLYRDEENALGFVAGSGALSLIIFGLCTVGLARKGVFLGLAAAALALAYWRGAHKNIRPRFTPLPRWWRRMFLGVFAVFTILYFFTAMAPEFSPDGVSYHLSFVAKYNRAHGFVPILHNMYAQLSQGIELLYLMAFSFGRHSAAALVHYAFLLALTLALSSYGRRIGYPVAGVASALLVYVSPVVGMDGATSYIDVAVAAILFTVFYLLQLWDRQRSQAALALIGFVAGFGYAAKYTAFLAVPYAVGFVLWRTKRLKPAALVGASSLVLMAPWVIKNLLWVGNPFSPMLNSWFSNPVVHISMERGWAEYLRNYDVANKWTIPLEATIWGQRLCGLLGPVFLLIPVGFFALRAREGRRVLAAAALFTLPYFANIGTRFFIPALPFYAFALALALMNTRILLPVVLVAHAALSWPSIARKYTDPSPWMLDRIPAKQALRIESEDSWLSRKQPDYQIAKLLEAAVPANARVFTMNGMPEAYTTREIWVRFQSAPSEALGDTFFSAYTADYQPRCAEIFEFAPLTERKIRLTQTGPSIEQVEWTMSEFRVYTSGKELPRSPAWRIHSSINHWGDIALALDNSPVTRWRTWERFKPGMSVELDLGSDQSIDRVRLESPLDCTVRVLRLDVAGADGTWRKIADQARIEAVNAPSFMGKAAIREMKARGVDYFFIREGEPGAAEIQENPEAWGLTVIGTASNGKLYRLDAGLPVLADVATASR
jgi:hypothetical protein